MKNRYVPSGLWQRVALGLLSSATAMAVLSAALLMFSDGVDRAWVAAALGLHPPPPVACNELPPPDGCDLRLAAAAPAPPASLPAKAR